MPAAFGQGRGGVYGYAAIAQAKMPAAFGQGRGGVSVYRQSLFPQRFPGAVCAIAENCFQPGKHIRGV
jgi:hypothetical protein